MSLYHELKRRSVFRMGAAYLAMAWLVLQILDVVQNILVVPDWIGRYALFALIIGFPFAIVLAWVYELTPEGVKHMDDVDVPPKSTPFGGRKIDFLIIGALSLVIVLLIVDSYILRPDRPGTVDGVPMVSNVTRLTKAQVIFPPTLSDYPVVIDGTRMYFSDWATDQVGMMEISTNGGEAVRVPFESFGGNWARPLAMAPGGAQMLLAGFNPETDDWWGSLSLWSVVGGGTRRMSDGYDATYSADGQQVFYLDGDDENGGFGLFLANADFTDPIKLGKTPGLTHWPNFSPDGSRIRFQVLTGKNPNTIWEISADGTDLHPLLPDWEKIPHCCGSWTPDGKFYVFQATHDNRTQLWAIREDNGSSSGVTPTPVQISKGALDFRRPTLTEGGKKIFAMGWQLRGEVVRYDKETKRFSSVPELNSLSAEWLSWSRDGQHLAYVTYPEADLWISRSEGSHRLQLTFPPMRAWNPQWSPDGQSVAFRAQLTGQFAKTYIVDADGQNLRPLTTEDRREGSPSWSPDGATLVFTAAGKHGIQLYDVASGNVSVLEGSDGLWGPKWSPDGNFIAAKSGGSLKLFDVSTGHVETLLKHDQIEGYYWSTSSEYLYYYDWIWGAPDRSVYRVNMEDKSIEKVVSIGNVRSVWGVGGMWVGISPDGAPLMLRDLSIHHIYALDWLPE